MNEELYNTVERLDEMILRLNYHLATNGAYMSTMIEDTCLQKREANRLIDGVDLSNSLIIKDFESIANSLTKIMRSDKMKG